MQVKKVRPMSEGQLEEAARLFRLLGEAARLRLLQELMAGPRTVGELVQATGLSQANVSKHLALLAQGRFVRGKREGNFVRYEICDLRLQPLCELICARLRDQAETLVRTLVDPAADSGPVSRRRKSK